MDVMPVVDGIRYLRRNLDRWVRPEPRGVDLHFRPGSNRVVHQPLGVVGIISPWNYPVALTLMPLATALAAGNRAMIKPSEMTPATSALLASMLAGVFAAEQVAVVLGDAGVGAASIEANSAEVAGVISDGLIIARLPAASAVASGISVSATG